MDEQLAGFVAHHPVMELLRRDDEVGFALLPKRDGLPLVFEDSMKVNFVDQREIF